MCTWPKAFKDTIDTFFLEQNFHNSHNYSQPLTWAGALWFCVFVCVFQSLVCQWVKVYNGLVMMMVSLGVTKILIYKNKNDANIRLEFFFYLVVLLAAMATAFIHGKNIVSLSRVNIYFCMSWILQSLFFIIWLFLAQKKGSLLVSIIEAAIIMTAQQSWLH